MFAEVAEVEKLFRFLVAEWVVFLGKVGRDFFAVTEEINLGLFDLKTGRVATIGDGDLSRFGPDVGYVTMEVAIEVSLAGPDADCDEHIGLRDLHFR